MELNTQEVSDIVQENVVLQSSFRRNFNCKSLDDVQKPGDMPMYTYVLLETPRLQQWAS